MIRQALAVLISACALMAYSVSAKENSGIGIDSVKGIMIVEPASKVEKQASNDLRRFLKMLYGVDIPEISNLDGLKDGEAAIILGKATVSAGLVTKDELAKVSPGGYVIKCGGDRIAIAGADAWTTYFGMIGFLERLGMRFYLPDSSGTYVPKVESRNIQPYTVFERPVFSYRGGWDLVFRQCSRIMADPRKALNPELFDPKKTGSDLWIDHSAGYLVPKLFYYDTHPEYYAMGKDGKRIAKNAFSDHRTPLCLSNPDITKISIERALKWIEMNPDSDYFSITYGDTGFWCQCPECLKLDPAPGEYASRLLHWVNPVAKGIAEKYPDKIVTTFAYAGSDKVPPSVKPEKNVCMVVATGAGNLLFYDHSMAQGTTVTKGIEEWIALIPGRVMVCEYLGAYEPAMLDQMTGRLRYYAKIGLSAVKTTYGAPVNFRNMWRYVWTKMEWDPSQDAHALAGDFLRFYYGPAAEPLEKYFKIVHEQYAKTLASGKTLNDGYPPDFYTDEFVRKCTSCFDEAAAENKKKSSEIEYEKLMFLQDALAHLGSYSLTSGGSGNLISFIIDEAVNASAKCGREVEFKKNADITARKLAAKNSNPKLLEFIRGKIGENPAYAPDKIEGGLRFSPMLFSGADYGPEEFGPHMSHKSMPCPPKLCAGVLASAKDSRGNSTSTEMKIEFKLDEIPGDGAAILELEGQDGISKWAHEKQFKLMSRMEVSVNGKKLWDDECGFVRGNWSKRTFEIPPGVLKAGNNEITVKNTTRQTYGAFAACWVLISDVQLKFK